MSRTANGDNTQRINNIGNIIELLCLPARITMTRDAAAAASRTIMAIVLTGVKEDLFFKFLILGIQT